MNLKVYVVLFEQECGYLSPGLEAIFLNQNDAVDFVAKKSREEYAPLYFIEVREVQ